MIRSLKIISLAFALVPEIATGQIISVLTSTDSLPSSGSAGIISDVEQMNGQEQFLDWDSTLGNFADVALATQNELMAKIEKEKAKDQSEKKEKRIPSYPDENGIDLYMLTNEGITLYMAMLSPVFYQETTEDMIRWIRYFAYNKHERTQKMFNRYTQWEPYIKQVFKENNIPEEIAELCMIESACTYTAKSSAGAVGMWQIMPETARSWGMRVNMEIDERKDPIRSTNIAAKILGDNHRMEKDWTMCIAGYNCGMGRVQKIIKAKGHSWPDAKPLFPKETQQYIPSLLAIHYVWNYRKQLGFAS